MKAYYNDAKYIYDHINPLSHNRTWKRAHYINSEAQVNWLVIIWRHTRCIKNAHLWRH